MFLNGRTASSGHAVDGGCAFRGRSSSDQYGSKKEQQQLEGRAKSRANSSKRGEEHTRTSIHRRGSCTFISRGRARPGPTVRCFHSPGWERCPMNCPKKTAGGSTVSTTTRMAGWPPATLGELSESPSPHATAVRRPSIPSGLTTTCEGTVPRYVKHTCSHSRQPCCARQLPAYTSLFISVA